MKKSDLLIDTNGYVLNLLEKILNANVIIKGVENIPKDNPRLFIANHFTRTEAMLVPYTMYNLTGKKVGVIADDSLFKSYFGNFLSKLGAMSKTDPTRNNHIIGDLITSCKDWMIFPEGRMVKAKDIEKIDKHFCVKIDGSCQRVHTGAVYFSLYSQLLREDYFNYKVKNFKKFQRKYFVNSCSEINKNETMIVPINISYSKIRNGNNFLIDMVEKLYGSMGENFKEELEIESNIVLNSKIIIQILKPVSTTELLEKHKNELNHKSVLNSIRSEITHNLMNKIYESLTINFDHIFVLLLFLYPKKDIDIKHFKRLIYLAIYKIKKRDLFFDEDIDKDILKLISYEDHKQFEEVLGVAIKDGVIEINNDVYSINKQALLNNYTHHTIRLKNVLKVILNEIQINEKVMTIMAKLVRKTPLEIDDRIEKALKRIQREKYENSYTKFLEYADLKPKNIGEDIYLDNENSDCCVIALHGFSSAPKEVEELANYLYENGFAVHAPRLDGHGTSPEDLKDKKWQDWYDSVSRCITIASIKYKKLFIVGFSTGGLLALLSAKKPFFDFSAIICINAALNLKDIRVKTLLPAVSFWNDLVEAFNENDYKKEYLDNIAENPDINYDKHYIESIEQLSLLMSESKKNLNSIKTPTLVIQAKDDPVVNPSSAYEIYNKISSKKKEMIIVEASNHVIVRGENSEKLFKDILEFINKNMYPHFLH